MITQSYEDYWQLTLEYSDFTSDKFNQCLQIIVDFIDNNDMNKYANLNKQNKALYKEFQSLYKVLQNQVFNFNPKNNYASTRKSINQFLKLGFINNFLQSYHYKTKEFLNENDKERKRRIYSEIMYDNASFCRSVSKPSNAKEINFLIKTMQYCKTLTKQNLMALMEQDVSQKEYIMQNELDLITQKTIDKNTSDKKYNQLNYLWNICVNVLTGIYINDKNEITLEKQKITDSEVTKGRDPYKQLLYKFDLFNESKIVNNDIVCFVENLKYPSLIASHIKPFISCNEIEQFDYNNGLLLSKNMDYLFDNGWISFDDSGKIICAKNLDSKLKEYLSNKKLNSKYLTQKRLEYLQYHRNNVFNDNKKYKF
ncbi:hypothetical protein CCZ01_02605 [Helicobacter monodelphidis]|uniref:HNH endonuclease n=1 Tax=Helicobacter sp. 15-1451 TaxID=2004995 RepID=UPI000DCB8F48|nr:HNH endonuclease [Helicobacter sp. 15-1451]RAX58326.1 hypothetical protein CCZ01_02605 [Helicobacter sp. 15-1451]